MAEFANVHNDVFLTNISVAYTNADYHAEDVFPSVPVDKRSDKYPLYNKDAFLRNSGVDAQGKPASIRRPGALSTEITFDLSKLPYYCEQMARNKPVYDAEVALQDSPLNAQVDAAEAVMEFLLLDNEQAVASKAMKRANYAASNKAQLVTNTTSWLAATGLPITTDLPNAKRSVVKSLLRAPNSLLVDYDAAIALSQNLDYTKRFQGVNTQTLTLGGLLPVVAGLTVIEATTQRATSNENVTPVTTGYVWQDDQGQDAALVYYRNPQRAQLKGVFFGLTFEAPDDSTGARGYATKRWREENRDLERIETRTTRDWRFPCTDGSTNGDNANGYATGGYIISGVTL